MDDSDYAKGMAVRRKALGDAYVDRATESANDFDRDFQQLITKYAWGGVWARPGFSAASRSIVTIAILASLGREDELRLHLRATRNTGASRDEIREALMHVAIYAGVPAANTAFKIAKSVFAEMDSEPAR
jgi:4-carboxymuconolactone decarboxylase